MRPVVAAVPADVNPLVSVHAVAAVPIIVITTVRAHVSICVPKHALRE